MKWRYSLRWKLPHRPCPGPQELISVVVEAGQAAPEEVMSRWVAGSGYAVCVDFLGVWVHHILQFLLSRKI